MSHTWVKHPGTGGVWACPNEALETQIKRGWEPCEDPGEDESRLHDPKPVKPAAKKAESPKKSGD